MKNILIITVYMNLSVWMLLNVIVTVTPMNLGYLLTVMKSLNQ